MSSACDKIDNWDHMTPDNKVDAVQDLLGQMASDYDVPVPEVVSGVPDFPDTPEDDSQKAAAYDPDTNTMYINDDLFNDRGYSAQDVLHEAGHEFGHELFDENFADENTQPGDSEAYAEANADQLTDELNDYCNDPPPPESPGDYDPNVGDWTYG